MIVLVKANILTVGLNGKAKALRELPIRVMSMQSGKAAAGSLKTEKVDSVISNWDLDDMKDGLFLKRLKTAKPNIPTIVFIRPGDKDQEIAARSLGVSAVLTEDTSDAIFEKTVANILGLTEKMKIKSISSASAEKLEKVL